MDHSRIGLAALIASLLAGPIAASASSPQDARRLAAATLAADTPPAQSVQTTRKSAPGAAPSSALPAQAEDKQRAKDTAPSTPQAHAEEIAARLPFVKRALHELRHAAAEIKDQPLRAAVEAQIQAPWLPPEAYAFAHPAETEAMLRKAGLLAPDAKFVIPPLGAGSLGSAPGGPCVTGHHGYPGGLAVHEWANLSHARALAGVYKSVYGVDLNDDLLAAAALWHDTMKAGTLPWDASGDCPHAEPQLAGTALHHTLGIAAAILRHLPAPVVLVIASSHVAPTKDHANDLCNWYRAAGIIADGDEHRLACPAFDEHAPKPPLEAFVNNSADSDYALTVSTWSWYAAQTPGGWERFTALEADGNDLAAFQRAGQSANATP